MNGFEFLIIYLLIGAGLISFVFVRGKIQFDLMFEHDDHQDIPRTVKYIITFVVCTIVWPLLFIKR